MLFTIVWPKLKIILASLFYVNTIDLNKLASTLASISLARGSQFITWFPVYHMVPLVLHYYKGFLCCGYIIILYFNTGFAVRVLNCRILKI